MQEKTMGIVGGWNLTFGLFLPSEPENNYTGVETTLTTYCKHMLAHEHTHAIAVYCVG